jgi:hypothetical protein
MSGRPGQDIVMHGQEANRLPLASASVKMNSLSSAAKADKPHQGIT